MPWQAEVAISDATLYYDKLYTYEIPASLQGRVFVGSMVLIPFGQGRAVPRSGVVMSLEEVETLHPRTKSLYDVAPEDAKLTEELLSIVSYLKQATFCTWYEAVKAIIPYGAQYKPAQENGAWVLKKQLQRHTETLYSLAEAEDAVQDAVRKNVYEEEKTKKSTRKITEKQQIVLDFLRDNSATKNEVCEATGVTAGVLSTLVKNGLIITNVQDKTVSLIGGLTQKQVEERKEIVLSEEQQAVADELCAEMQNARPQPALLYGVTGSGKTPLFMYLIEQVLQKGKTALILVPEIGLTPQMIQQLAQNFGDKVAVQHSRLSNTERLLQWRQIQRGEAQVVVGTRSAIFAPLENIGILIIDEEQERTYQSESSPRYDAIEVARKRAAHHGGLLLLASATPAITDYYFATQNRYKLVKLPHRYGNIPLPSVEMVDMRAELSAGNNGAVSRRLTEEIKQNLQDQKQTILLLNRRGYRTVGMCRECGNVIKCTECSVPMVYHKAGNKLLCHYCGKTISPVPQTCPECAGEMRYTGVGTQHLEEELAEKFPTARVLRMDMDSTSKKGSHSKMFSAFARGEYDILLGTQMVAKGLDFEHVNLVGVIGIDSLLFSQGYRAYETVFSLVTQVVGRSGRKGAAGRALIQTQDPENPVLNLAALQDYDAFFKQEIMFRKLGLYPPFCTICMIGFVADTEKNALTASAKFASFLVEQARKEPDMPLRILGPAPMNIVQVAGVFRFRLTVKCRNDAKFRQLAQTVLEQYNKQGFSRKASVYLDFHSDAGN